MSNDAPGTMNLRGRKALVTGGANGIGEAAVRALAARGAQVVVADRDGHHARNLAEEVDGTAWEADLLDPAQIAELEQRRLEVDILVNNAGIQVVSPIEEFDPEAFRRIQRLMLEVPFLLMRAAIPHMYEQGWGRVINISSVHGLRASAFKSAYVSAKHGLEGLSKVMAVEGGPHGVTSNCINPGYVRTALVEGQIADQARTHGISEPEVVSSILLARSSIKQLIEPSQVGSLVAWLASDDAAMVSGSSFAMDGAWTAS